MKPHPKPDSSQPDFSSTLPFPPASEEDKAHVFGALGVEAVRASMVDVESMECESSWRITESGGQPEDTEHVADSGFPTAMATIVHLNHASGDDTVTRKLDARRWAFAWRIDDRHVAVAEASYRTPRSEQSDADTKLVRMICDTGIRSGRFEAADAVNERMPEAAPAAGRGVAATMAGLLPPGRKRLIAVVLLALYLVAAGVLYAIRQHTGELQAEAAQLQAQADSMMLQRLSGSLANGDYGEVQAELDEFSAARYFTGAVVTNARGRAVALAGEVRETAGSPSASPGSMLEGLLSRRKRAPGGARWRCC